MLWLTVDIDSLTETAEENPVHHYLNTVCVNQIIFFIMMKFKSEYKLVCEENN